MLSLSIAVRRMNIIVERFVDCVVQHSESSFQIPQLEIYPYPICYQFIQDVLSRNIYHYHDQFKQKTSYKTFTDEIHNSHPGDRCSKISACMIYYTNRNRALAINSSTGEISEGATCARPAVAGRLIQEATFNRPVEAKVRSWEARAKILASAIPLVINRNVRRYRHGAIARRSGATLTIASAPSCVICRTISLFKRYALRSRHGRPTLSYITAANWKKGTTRRGLEYYWTVEVQRGREIARADLRLLHLEDEIYAVVNIAARLLLSRCTSHNDVEFARFFL